jgi:hypothetical protein
MNRLLHSGVRRRHAHHGDGQGEDQALAHRLAPSFYSYNFTFIKYLFIFLLLIDRRAEAVVQYRLRHLGPSVGPLLQQLEDQTERFRQAVENIELDRPHPSKPSADAHKPDTGKEKETTLFPTLRPPTLSTTPSATITPLGLGTAGPSTPLMTEDGGDENLFSENDDETTEAQSSTLGALMEQLPGSRTKRTVESASHQEPSLYESSHPPTLKEVRSLRHSRGHAC